VYGLTLQIKPTIAHVASFPGLYHLQLHEERRGPGIFSRVCDVEGRKVVERT